MNEMIAPVGIAEQVVGTAAAGDKRLVGFIQDESDVVFTRQLMNFLQHLRRHHHTGGIAGRHHQQRPGPLVDARGQGAGVRDAAVLIVEGHKDAADAEHVEGHHVVEVIRHHDHHLVAGAAQGHHRQPEGLAGTDRQAQVLRYHLRPVAALVIGA